MNEDNIKINLKQLAKICNDYDGDGDSQYYESKYEGKAVFKEIYETLTGRQLDDENKYFNY